MRDERLPRSLVHGHRRALGGEHRDEVAPDDEDDLRVPDRGARYRLPGLVVGDPLLSERVEDGAAGELAGVDEVEEVVRRDSRFRAPRGPERRRGRRARA